MSNQVNLTTLQRVENINSEFIDSRDKTVSQEFADRNIKNTIVADSSIDEILEKESFLKLPAQIFHPYRLMILIALRRFGALDFPALRDGIQIKSDGNLANHLRVLEDLELIRYNKEFVDRKPKTFYELTEKGKVIVQSLVDHFEDFINDTQRSE